MTSTDIIISSPAGREFERVETMGAPEPGTYWKAIADIPRQSTQRIVIREVSKGEALLLIDVVMADGVPHTYVLAAHPRHGKNARPEEVHAEDFHDLFEPEPDGHAQRSAEISKLQAEMLETQKAILAPPPEASNHHHPQLAHDPGSSDATALVTRDQVAAMTQYAAAVQHQAKIQAQWIETQTTKLTGQSSLLACFYSEAAQVQLARANAALSGAKKILKTVDNLRLYTGDDVDVIKLRDGAPAEPGEPLTIYQEVLAFDEEAAILVEQGGLDHTKVEHLVEAIADIRLLDRMIPAPRGVAMVRFRNNFKEFVKGEDIGARLYNIHMNEVSQTNRLLVRDGEQAYLVSAESAFSGLTQLLTSTGEQSAHFKDGEVRQEHLGYARARASQLASLEKNAKALIVLWGLRDRGEILGTWEAPMGASWIDPAFQNDWMRLLSIDSLIAVKRPSYATWRDEQNRTLAPGSWVAIHYAAVDAPHSLEPAADVSIAQVYSDRGALKAKFPVKSRYSWRTEGRIKNAVVDLDAKAIRGGNVLCLDRVSAPDLQYYLTSRTQRRDYSAYITLFREAARWVEARDNEEASIRSQIHQAAADAGMVIEASAMDRALTEAVAAARLSMRGAKIPDRNAPAFKTFIRTALDILHAKLRGADGIAAAAEAAFGSAIVKVAMDREGYRAYVKPSEDQRDARLPADGVYQAIRFAMSDQGAVAVGAPEITTIEPKRGEEVIRAWGGPWPTWAHASPPEECLRVFNQIHGASELAAPMLTEAFGAEIVARQVTYWRRSRSRQIRRMLVGIPIGTLKLPSRKDLPCLLYAVADGLRLAAFLGKGPKGDAKTAISKWYAKPEYALDSLEETAGLSPWSIEGIMVESARGDLDPIRYWESNLDSGFHISMDDLKTKRAVITTASELGIKLVPEILDFVKAPTRPVAGTE